MLKNLMIIVVAIGLMTGEVVAGAAKCCEPCVCQPVCCCKVKCRCCKVKIKKARRCKVVKTCCEVVTCCK